MLDMFASSEALQQYLLQFGMLAPLIFMLIQILQVVFPIIPGGLTCVAGVICFGPLWGFIYNYISIYIGSCINFLLIRKFGKPLFIRLSSPRLYKKYIGWLNKGERFDKLFAIAIFMPVALDDFLCMLAGLTRMTFKKFAMIILEAMNCQILILVRQLDVYDDILFDYVQYANNTEEFASYIQQLYQDSKFYEYCCKSSKSGASEYNEEAVAFTWQAYYFYLL